METKNSKSDNSNTGYKGIYYQKSVLGRTPKFISQIVIRQGDKINKVYIRQYSTLDEAILAREEFITELY